MQRQRRILFLSKGADDASTRYRALQYFDLWTESGFCPNHAEVPKTVSGWIRLRHQIAQADVVVVLRKLLPEPACWLLRRFARRLVFDLDDAIFCRDTGTASSGRMRRFRNIVRRADAVWAGNEYLATAVKHARDGMAASSVLHVPTALNPGRYAVSQQNEESVVLVWIGSSSTRKYLESLLPVLERLAECHTNIRLRVVADFEFPCEKIPVEFVRWSSLAEIDSLQSSHIGLAPLTDDRWTQGKCGCKVLQYMAAGLPVVSSDMPVHRSLLGTDCGSFAESESAWLSALSSLLRSREMRIQCGDAGLERVRQSFSLNAVFPEMLGTVEALCRQPDAEQAA